MIHKRLVISLTFYRRYFLCDETNMIEVVEDSRLLRVQFLPTNLFSNILLRL